MIFSIDTIRKFVYSIDIAMQHAIYFLIRGTKIRIRKGGANVEQLRRGS